MLQVPEECPQAVSDLIDACLISTGKLRPTARQVFDRLHEVLSSDAPGGSAAPELGDL